MAIKRAGYETKRGEKARRAAKRRRAVEWRAERRRVTALRDEQ
jgi:hypothetical protein